MSAQCWCYHCSGKVVSRNTFNRHGGKSAPDPPVAPITVEVLSMPDEVPCLHSGSDAGTSSDDDSTDDEDDDDLGEEYWRNLFADGDADATRFGRAQFSKENLVLLFLDWMSTHKATDEASAAVWGLLVAMAPAECVLPRFGQVKYMLKRRKNAMVRRIDICQNDCIAYYDTKHMPVMGGGASSHWHRTKCPVCGMPRYIDDPVTGLQQSVKVMYHFPVAGFIRSLFQRADLVPHLFWDSGEHPPSHLTRSRGFKKKVVDNPKMKRYTQMHAL